MRQALTAVGRANARRLCLDAATYRFLERAPGNGTASRGQMHLHAVSVAAIAAEVAARAGVPAESAHLAGLLHDFGKLLMPLAYGEMELDDSPAAATAARSGRRPSGRPLASTARTRRRSTRAPAGSTTRSARRSPTTTAGAAARGASSPARRRGRCSSATSTASRRSTTRSGTPPGDLLLTDVANILAAYGHAGRLGGDEFALWLSGDEDDARSTAERIVADVDRVLAEDWKRRTQAGISIGVAAAPAQGADLATLLEVADAALYAAKRSGGARCARPAAVA